MSTKRIVMISAVIMLIGFVLSGFVFSDHERQTGQNQELQGIKEEQKILLERIAELEEALGKTETDEPVIEEPVMPTVSVAYVIDEYDAVNVRADAGTGYPVVERVPQKSPMEILEEKDDWYRVKLESGNIAWVASWVVRVQEE